MALIPIPTQGSTAQFDPLASVDLVDKEPCQGMLRPETPCRAKSWTAIAAERKLCDPRQAEATAGSHGETHSLGHGRTCDVGYLIPGIDR